MKQGLFDIKLLNDIEDIAVRANLKKMYMGAKKESKNSNQIIPEMINELDSNELLDDQLSYMPIEYILPSDYQ